MNKKMHKSPLLNALTLAAALSLTALSAPAFAEEMVNAMNSNEMNVNQTSETYTNDWKSPIATEFTRLDVSGNGLLLPNEASKGKAFNKKTFAKADVDHDGTIDQNEYEYFKTGAWPAGVQTENMPEPDVSAS